MAANNFDLATFSTTVISPKTEADSLEVNGGSVSGSKLCLGLLVRTTLLYHRVLMTCIERQYQMDHNHGVLLTCI